MNDIFREYIAEMKNNEDMMFAIRTLEHMARKNGCEKAFDWLCKEAGMMFADGMWMKDIRIWLKERKQVNGS